MVALPLAANAQASDGLYLSAGVGANIMQDQTIVSAGGIALNGAKLQTNVGVAGLGAVGWGFGNGFGAELEFNYRYNRYKSTSAFGLTRNVSGKEQKYSPMVNVLYDFSALSPSFVPYVGGGVGYQAINESGNGLTSTTKSTFAQHGIVGAAFPLPTVAPGLPLTAEYRFLGTTSNRSYNGLALRNDNNHTIALGLHYFLIT